MANLPNDRLPDEFEIVIHGTGLTESILAAASARVGKAVLHIDRNSFYGELWGSLVHRDLEWLLAGSEANEDNYFQPTIETPPLSAGESLIDLASGGEKQVFNVQDTIHKRDTSTNSTTTTSDIASPTNTATTANTTNTTIPTVEMVQEDHSAVSKNGGHPPPSQDSVETPAQSPPDGTSPPPSGGTFPPPSGGASPPPSGGTTPPPPGGTPLGSPPSPPAPVTWDSLGKDIRRFNYDILPKLLYCRGGLVSLITDSGVSRYMEFKAVESLFQYDGESSSLIPVPSSRSDVFSSKIVSMMDKRRLMKFLSFCAEYDQHTAQYEDYRDKPYREYLSSQGLQGKLADFIIYSLAFADDTTTTAEGLKLTQLFMNSLGRFGNAPFLYPIFGSGEIPQAYCRLSAVYGGVYCLKLALKSIVTDNGVVKGVICSSGQRIKCSRVVCNASLLKHHTPQHISDLVVSRAVYVSDGPLVEESSDKVAIVTVPPGTLGPAQSSKIQLIQLDCSTLNTARGTYMTHAMYKGDNYSLLEQLAERLFNSGDGKPHLLRTLYYNIRLYGVMDEGGINDTLPEGVIVTSDPDLSLSYESCVKQAKDIFTKTFPSEEYLPRIPEPSDIVYEEYEPENGDSDGAGKTPDVNETEDNAGVTPVVDNDNEAPATEN